MPEEESAKTVRGGPGITAGGNVQISNVSGQLAIGADSTQIQIISPTDVKDLLDSLHEFQKGVPKLDLSPGDQSIVNGELSAAIKEAKQDTPALSRIKSRFVSAISTVKEAGKSIKDISELYEPAKEIAKLVGLLL
jgi:hypothetical protein